jgi:hypothetical protein
VLADRTGGLRVSRLLVHRGRAGMYGEVNGTKAGARRTRVRCLWCMGYPFGYYSQLAGAARLEDMAENPGV